MLLSPPIRILKNAWGIAFGPENPIWIADNGTGLSTLYDGAGNIIPLVVTIPAPAADDTSAPTGLVINPSGDFVVSTVARLVRPFSSSILRTGLSLGGVPESI